MMYRLLSLGRMLRYGGTLAVAILVLASAVPCASQAQTVFILDASQSMWGQINGVNKTVMLRDAFKDALTPIIGQSQGAILAFGHTKSAGCDDIGVLRPLGQINEAFTSAIDEIKPRGSAPLAASLEKAAQLLPANSPSPSIVLLADGPDNCKRDPCAAAEALSEKFSRLKVHVIAFDATAREGLAGLSCIAEPSGGLFFTATNDAELRDALQQTVAAVHSNVFLPVAGVGIGGKIGVTPPRIGEPGRVALSAHLAQGSPAIDGGLRWRVFDRIAQRDGSYKLVKDIVDPLPSFELPPGEYLVNVAYGRANLTKKLNVWPGQQLTDSFVLNAGGLRLSAMLPDGQPLPDNLIRFDVLSEATDQFGNRERVVDNVRPGVILRLNSGFYHIVSVYGDSNARIESDVIVEPGKLTDAIVKHDAGKVAFRLVAKPGGEALADTQWVIQTAGGEVVKETAGAFPTHILAAGTYRVIATHRDAVYEQEFTLAGGQTRQIEVVIPGGGN